MPVGVFWTSVYSKMYILSVSVGSQSKQRDPLNCILLLATFVKQQEGKQQTWKVTDLDIYKVLTYMAFA